ncbi:4-oxalomesaconate tautomerase [Streptomyces sp. NPDC059740]|uniref:4-oxalomesaconate tautomerase n=1 Tax=Streptomyces sp. NPDC059740 TaxID=3346926 RepID=UPI003668C2FE
MSGPAELPCMLMRGGTSKGAYFLAADLPPDRAAREDLLLRTMGSPDPRQIDGLGGAHPLTSKVAVVSASADPAADVDYLFLQVGVEDGEVSDRQNCGNLLAGVGPFAVERGLVAPGDDRTSVRIRMLNSGDLATATFPTPGGRVSYAGDTRISGVPGSAAAVVIEFPQGAGPLLPTGRPLDTVADTPVTCVDNGMPTVLVAAASLGVSGYESPGELEGDEELVERVQEIRRQAGELMGLGDVSQTTVPKVSLLAPPVAGGAVTTRTFIPRRCHTSIGVLGAAGVAAGLRLADGVARRIAPQPAPGEPLRIEHPTGFLEVSVDMADGPDGAPAVARTALVRTARKIFDGTVFPRPLPQPGPHPAPAPSPEGGTDDSAPR